MERFKHESVHKRITLPTIAMKGYLLMPGR